MKEDEYVFTFYHCFTCTLSAYRDVQFSDTSDDRVIRIQKDVI